MAPIGFALALVIWFLIAPLVAIVLTNLCNRAICAWRGHEIAHHIGLDCEAWTCERCGHYRWETR